MEYKGYGILRSDHTLTALEKNRRQQESRNKARERHVCLLMEESAQALVQTFVTPDQFLILLVQSEKKAGTLTSIHKHSRELTSIHEHSRAFTSSPKEVKHDRGKLRENFHQYVNNITWTGSHKLCQREYKYDLNMNSGINSKYVVTGERTEHGKMKGPKN